MSSGDSSRNFFVFVCSVNSTTPEWSAVGCGLEAVQFLVQVHGNTCGWQTPSYMQICSSDMLHKRFQGTFVNSSYIVLVSCVPSWRLSCERDIGLVLVLCFAWSKRLRSTKTVIWIVLLFNVAVSGRANISLREQTISISFTVGMSFGLTQDFAPKSCQWPKIVRRKTQDLLDYSLKTALLQAWAVTISAFFR